MLLYRTPHGPIVETDGVFTRLTDEWNDLLNRDDLPAYLAAAVTTGTAVSKPEVLLSPVATQEVWAAGVTYFRSRTARMEESKEAGGGSFYDRVYAADRPEIFFKASPHRVAAPGGLMHLRRDSKWMVPEPELTLVITRNGTIIGCTVGNDLSCRDIEGENPLYLPQAKSFRLSAAVGPCIKVQHEPLPAASGTRMRTCPVGFQSAAAAGAAITAETNASASHINFFSLPIVISRAGAPVFTGDTTLAQLKRTPEELAGWLYKDNDFPNGAFLMTGTGIVPGDEFTLALGDEVSITIEGIGTLVNVMG